MSLQEHIQTEIDASYLYGVLAEKEQDEVVADVFRELSAIERSHAIAFLKKNNADESQLPGPSIRAKALNLIGRILGYDMILGTLLNTEKSISIGISKFNKKTNRKPAVSDSSHVKILKNILETDRPINVSSLAKFEKRHRSVGGNALRAAVLGGNDGLVSNFSLIMGVAGATNGSSEVLLAGSAGMLAGALSMALGEWISVKSSQELYENQMDLEMEELETNPDGEERELVLIYKSKGIPEEQAKQMAAEIIKDKDQAHRLLITEELGISPEELEGSPMEAAISSFILFAFGAIIPLLPFFFLSGVKAIVLSTISSALGLFLIGGAITLFTGKSVWKSGMRQVVFGLLAALITFGIGKLIGVSIQ